MKYNLCIMIVLYNDMLSLHTVDFCSLCVIICINLVACEKYCLDCLCVEHAL